MTAWHKIRWMIWYECLMHWRRRNLLLVAGGFLFALISLTLFTAEQNKEFETPPLNWERQDMFTNDIVRVQQEGETVIVTQQNGDGVDELARYTPTQYHAAIRTTLLANLLVTTLVILLVIIPPMMSDNIAYDRHTGVRELLNALPMTKATYLGGKLWATWRQLA